MRTHIIMRLLLYTLLALVLGVSIWVLIQYIWIRGHYVHQLWLVLNLLPDWR